MNGVNRPPTVTIDAIDDVGGRMEGSERGLMTIEIHNEQRKNVNENRIYCEGDSVAWENVNVNSIEPLLFNPSLLKRRSEETSILLMLTI